MTGAIARSAVVRFSFADPLRKFPLSVQPQAIATPASRTTQYEYKCCLIDMVPAYLSFRIHAWREHDPRDPAILHNDAPTKPTFDH